MDINLGGNTLTKGYFDGILSGTIQLRNGSGPYAGLLAPGEAYFDTTNNKFYLGDGTTNHLIASGFVLGSPGVATSGGTPGIAGTIPTTEYALSLISGSGGNTVDGGTGGNGGDLSQFATIAPGNGGSVAAGGLGTGGTGATLATVINVTGGAGGGAGSTSTTGQGGDGSPLDGYAFVNIVLGNGGLSGTTGDGGQGGNNVSMPFIQISYGNGGAGNGAFTGGQGGLTGFGSIQPLSFATGNGGAAGSGGNGGHGGYLNGNSIQFVGGNGGDGSTGAAGGNGGNTGKIVLNGGNAGDASGATAGAGGGNGGTLDLSGANASGATSGIAGGSLTLTGGTNTITTSTATPHTLTIPSTQNDTFAMLGVAQTFTAAHTINSTLTVTGTTTLATSLTGIAKVTSGVVATASSSDIQTAIGASVYANYNDSRITGALQTSALGTGVQTALGNSVNATSGIVTANSSGYSSPNVSHTASNFLLLGHQGAFLSGRERLLLMCSGGGISWREIYGWGAYNPPTPPDETGTVVGARDPTVIHLENGTYLVAHTLVRGSSGTVSAYAGIAKAASLSSPLVHVTDVLNMGTGPKFFRDTNGNLYILASLALTQNTSTTGGIPDGVTWGTTSNLTWSDGTSGNASDSCLIKDGSTYGVFYARTGAAFTFRIGTSSSIGSGYADQGIITNWPSLAEGVSVGKDSTTGIWYAYFQARIGTYSPKTVVSTTTTPLVPSSWSAPVPLISTATGYAQTSASDFDNAGVWIEHSAAMGQDIFAAIDQAEFLRKNANDQPPGVTFDHVPVMFRGNYLTLYPTGQGTIAISGSVVTGTGTKFTHDFDVGSLIYAVTGSRLSVVRSVTSDTSMNLFYNGGFTIAAGSTYQYYSPIIAARSSNGSAITQFIDPYYGYHWSNGTVFFNTANTVLASCITGDSSGNLILQNIAIGGGGSGVYARGLASGNAWEVSGGHLIIAQAGRGIQVKEGSNCKQGVATLVAGTVTVSNTNVGSASRIFLTAQSLGTVTVPAALAITARTSGTSFTITSANATDTSVVAYEIFEPSP